MKSREVAVFLGLMAVVIVVIGDGGAAATFAAADEPGELYFPPPSGTWETLAPATAGWQTDALESALDYARQQRSSGLVVVLGGRILAEAYWQVEPPSSGGARWRYPSGIVDTTDDGRTIEDVASVQKSVISFLAGVARARDLVDFAAPVDRYLGEGWSKAPREAEAAITVRHLMAMASGLGPDLTSEAPAGTNWKYNTNVYSRMVQVLERATGLTVDDYTARWLTDPVGMSESRWAPRPWVLPGQEANRIGFATTARDLARFGILMLARGRWGERRLLEDEGYFAEALSPSQEHNPSYGLLWWLNGHPLVGASGERSSSSLVPSAPADLFAAQGALGRKLYVVPSLGLVVTRLGDRPPDRDFNEQLWARLMRAVRGD